jgi:hypothetical protein
MGPSTIAVNTGSTHAVLFREERGQISLMRCIARHGAIVVRSPTSAAWLMLARRHDTDARFES